MTKLLNRWITGSRQTPQTQTMVWQWSCDDQESCTINPDFSCRQADRGVLWGPRGPTLFYKNWVSKDTSILLCMALNLPLDTNNVWWTNSLAVKILKINAFFWGWNLTDLVCVKNHILQFWWFLLIVKSIWYFCCQWIAYNGQQHLLVELQPRTKSNILGAISFQLKASSCNNFSECSRRILYPWTLKFTFPPSFFPPFPFPWV